MTKIINTSAVFRLTLASIILLQVPCLVSSQLFGLRNEITSDLIEYEPTYFILASKTIRPGQVFKVIATVYRSSMPITVRASIQRNGVELASQSSECKDGDPETLLLRVPSSSLEGNYRLRVEGNLHGVLGGTAFLNETSLEFSQRSMTIFITTDKPVYKQGQTVKFRCVPVTTDLKAFTDAIDVYMLDPSGNIMRRWLSRQSNYGAVSLEYPLSSLPRFGTWTIRVVAQGQIEEKSYMVEEYHQTRFEVNVSMSPFVMDRDTYLYGSVMANFTSGIPVNGNLTLIATIQPSDRQGISLYPSNLPAIEQTYRHFNGYKQFQLELGSLSKLVNGISLDGATVTVKAYVGERFMDIVYSGYAKSKIFSSRSKLQFLGSSPQVFKPAMPFKSYVALSYLDGSPLPPEKLDYKYIDIQASVSISGRTINLPPQREAMSPNYDGIWEVTLDLRSYSQFKDKRILNEVTRARIEAFYTEQTGEKTRAILDLYPYYTASSRLIQVSTSTKAPKVGEFVIFHVRANYFVDTFQYAIVSKGMILSTGTQIMSPSITTFAVTLSPEMAPASTIVVYDITKGGEVTTDSLTFPVDGISRNNFSVTLNNRKDKSGDTIEVVVLGQPGTYIGLSAMDKDLYLLNGGNQINHVDVLRKMNTFDTDSNGTLTHAWTSRDGEMDQFLHFASPSLGIDANRTFEYAGLVVFTDGNITRRRETCSNSSVGMLSCLDGRQCYHASKRCDGRSDCSDATDEANCQKADPYDVSKFRMSRTNRLQRLYENSWLWRDINIGPLGYYTFNAPVPNSPASWIVTAFGMSNTHGFGLQGTSIPFSSVRPFYINVEMPSICNIGEQIGIRISIFNNLHIEIEVVVVLARSDDYKFVHVGPFGRVHSYAPQTSSGEHHHLVVIRPGKSSVVYMPIVAQRLGDINVTVNARTQIAKDVVTKLLHVEADGIPQHTHTSAVLDLSQGAYLIKYLQTNITDTPIIPFREERRYIFGSNKAVISIVGDVVGPAFPTIPVNASSLLRMPFDCGEQNMFNFAFNLYTLYYLRMTSQKTSFIEKQAFKYLNIQYQKQLTYQNSDGSFSAFRHGKEGRRPSVWLTAFAARILSKATFQEWETFLFIDPPVINKAITFILQHQTPDGAFYETSLNPYDRKMNLTSKALGDNIRLRNISLTAHVLITLCEVRDLRGEISGKASYAKLQAQRYLERMLHVIKAYEDPYELSIVTYALTLANSPEAEEAFNLLDSKMKEVSGMRYWSKETLPPNKVQMENNRPYLLPRLPDKFESLNVETTAYALLVHLAKQAVIQKEIVEWLNTHRLHTGAWSSTQDSIVAFTALIEYSIQSRLRDVTNIEVTIEAPSSTGFEKKLRITPENLSKLYSYEIPNAYGPVIIKAQGSGLALIQLDVEYNVDWAHLQIQPPVKAFDLQVHMAADGRNSSILLFRSCQFWTLTSEAETSGMAVLEVTIPTGYYIQQNDLDLLVNRSMVRNLREARFRERQVTFYFDYLDQSPTCVDFKVQRWHPVANMTRYMPVRVYDYYAPERFNETMVNAYSLYVLSICHVCGSYQCPYCPIFSSSPLLTYINTPLLVILIICSILNITRHNWVSGLM